MTVLMANGQYQKKHASTIIPEEPEIKRGWGKILREHNIVEYKSQADTTPSIAVFNKVVHGYVGLYASQENIKLTDMSATIVSFKKPIALFEVLEKELNYRVLQKSKGVYYIKYRGCAAEKSLAIQVIVSPELPNSEFVLKALRRGIDATTAQKVWEQLLIEDEEYQSTLAPWYWMMYTENEEILNNEGGNMKKMEKIVKGWMEKGLLADELKEARMEGRLEGRLEGEQMGELRGVQKGMQQGMARLYEYLKSGRSIEEAEREFAFR
jgi:hypothetical protein